MIRHIKESCGKVYEVQCEDCEYIAPNKLHYENHRRKLHANVSGNDVKEAGDDEEILCKDGLTEDDIAQPSKKFRNMRGISIVKLEESEQDPLGKEEEEKELSIPSPTSVGQEDYVPSDDSADEDWAEDVKQETSRKPSNPSSPASDHVASNATEGLTEEDISKPSKKLFKLGGISCVKLEDPTDELPEEGGGEDGEQSTHSPASVADDYVPSDDDSDSGADEDWVGDAKRKRTVSVSGRKPGVSGYAGVNLLNPAPARAKIVCGVCQKGGSIQLNLNRLFYRVCSTTGCSTLL